MGKPFWHLVFVRIEKIRHKRLGHGRLFWLKG